MKNGLYVIEITMLDGGVGTNRGVMELYDGAIRGGDPYFYYVGSYSFADGQWKGEIVNREHTPPRGAKPVFGGKGEVGIGFSGTYDDRGAEGVSTALAGKLSIRFKWTLRLIAEG